jgi:hypothetical protein
MSFPPAISPLCPTSPSRVINSRANSVLDCLLDAPCLQEAPMLIREEIPQTMKPRQAESAPARSGKCYRALHVATEK